MKKQIWIPILIVIIIIVVGLVIMAGNKQKPLEGEVKIGATLPLTGEAASWGQNALAGIKLAVQEINNHGGIKGRKVKLVSEDDKCSPKDGINAVNKLINIDKVMAILGPICSSAAGSEMPLVQEDKIPTIIVAASNSHLTKIGEYIFRIYPSDTLQGKYAAEFIFNNLGKKKVAVIYVKNDWGEGIQSVFVKRFKELGGQIVYKGNILQTETDFRTEIAKLKNSGANVLYLPVYPVNAVSAFKQMKETGLDIPIVGGDTFNGEEVVSSDYADGVFYTMPKFNLPKNFKERIKEVPGFSNLKIATPAPLGYDAAKVVFSAIEKAGINPEKIKDELKKISYKGISTPLIEFNENGDLKQAIFEVKVIKNKKSISYEK